LDSLTIPWAVVGRDNTRLFLAVVSVDEPPADLLPVARVHTGSRQLSHLREDLQEVEIEIEVAEEEHAELTRSRLALGIRLADAEDADARVAAQDVTLHDDRVFAVSGWAPADRAEELRAMAEQRGLALTLEPAGSGDEPPTLLENPERFAGAGALTSFYTTPPYGAWDPSLVVLVSFALFFAMILADAGYALVLLALVFLYRRRIGASVSGKRLLAVLWAVLGAAAGYGILAGSYFGFAPPAGSVLDAIAFIDIEDFDTMMTVSIIIGVVHVSVANLEVAIRSRVSSERQARFAWVATAWGGLVFWLGAPTFGAVLLGCGLLTIFVSGALGRPVTRPMDWLLRLMDGGLALTRLSTLFGDVLSYMRLFALGLASASLATTFNGLARDIAEGLPGVGLFLAILVLILGHAINLLLGIVSGVVHGLRLNFIEFFGWALSGEGYPFRAFARKERPKWTD
ncbi:MAG: V-type ATP synthase subunit I, partial [Pseudomonadota bacterium]